MATAANFTRDADTGAIVIKQGKTIGWAYVIYEDDGVTPRDVTDWTARMHVRSTYNSTTKLLDLSTENGKILNGGATGEFLNTILPVDTSYGAGTGIRVVGESLEAVYDYEVVDDAGVVWEIDSGTFTILREVTREV